MYNTSIPIALQKDKNAYPFLSKNTILIILFITTILTVNSLHSQEASVCNKATMLKKTVEKYHYSPRPIDDDYSELAFNEFIKLLDNRFVLLTKDDIHRLEVYKYEIDNNLIDGSCKLAGLAFDIFRDRLTSTDSILEYFKNYSFNYKIDESIDFEHYNGYLDKDSLIDYWRKSIKLQCLSEYYSKNDSVVNKQIPDDELIQIQRNIIDREICRLGINFQSDNQISKFVDDCYLKALSSAFDPHTNYFSVQEESSFTQMLSEDEYSFGFDVYLNDYGECEIINIVPGGPAWSSGNINEGDILLEISTDKASIQTSDCLAIEDVIGILYSDDIMGADILIKKKNNSRSSINLTKQEINIDENVISSYILHGEKKIGYIYLPIFYSEADMNNMLTAGCANDLAKELVRLKKENIQGLIIDIRNNGGGSMLEAIQIAGIFIDYGALAIFKDKEEKPTTIKDLYRGTIYSDPMIVMVNSYSASASELFAAAMQDHNRAIVVGSTTFGKSTAQNVLPLDAYLSDFNDYQPDNSNGYLKLTTGTFFRVTGQNHQKEGVIPDIVLPSIFDSIASGERSYPSALNKSKIDKKTYYYPLEALPITELSSTSNSRIISDSNFMVIKQLEGYLNNKIDQSSIPLEFNSFGSSYWSDTLVNDISFSFYGNNSPYDVSSPSYVETISHIIDNNNTTNAKKQVKEDIYIIESFRIITELINLSKKQ